METITTNTRTFELTGEEVHIHFTAGFPYFWLRNDGTYTVQMSLSPNISNGKDGVIEVPAGSSAGTMHGFNNTSNDMYLLGSGKVSSGKVQVMGTYTPENPFRKAQKGGGGAYEFSKNFSAHNLLTDYAVETANCTKTQDGERVTYTIPAEKSENWYYIATMIQLKRGKMYKLAVDKFDGYGRLAISSNGSSVAIQDRPYGRSGERLNLNAAGNFTDDNNLISYDNTNTKYFYVIHQGTSANVLCAIWYCSDVNRDEPNGTDAHSFDIGLFEEI